MKIKSLIYTSLAAALLFTSCEDLNKEPVFNDDTQAFVAFEKTTGTVIESNDGVPAVLEAPREDFTTEMVCCMGMPRSWAKR